MYALFNLHQVLNFKKGIGIQEGHHQGEGRKINRQEKEEEEEGILQHLHGLFFESLKIQTNFPFSRSIFGMLMGFLTNLAPAHRELAKPVFTGREPLRSLHGSYNILIIFVCSF